MNDIKDKDIPLLPLRDVVIFPSVVTPLFVGRDKSITALQAAMAGEKQIMLVAQKSAQQDDPNLDDLYSIGTISTILQLIKLPDGTLKVLVEGLYRVKVEKDGSALKEREVTISSSEGTNSLSNQFFKKGIGKMYILR